MIPILYGKTSIDFSTGSDRIGLLSETVSCTVKEDIEYKYECELTYPPDGAYANYLEIGNIIGACPNTYRLQDYDPTSKFCPDLFKIYKVTKSPNNLIKVYAEHISYSLGKVFPSFTSATNVSLSAFCNSVLNISEIAGYFTVPFYYQQNAEKTISFEYDKKKSLRDVFIGLAKQNDLYVEMHGLRIMYFINRARNTSSTPWHFFYGRNIKTFSYDLTDENAISNIIGYVGNTFAPSVSTGWNAEYPAFQREKLMDCSKMFNQSNPTAGQIKSKVETYVANNSFGPTISVSVEPLEELVNMPIQIGDHVALHIDRFGIGTQLSRIESYEYDSINERYKKIRIGVAKKTLADILINK